MYKHNPKFSTHIIYALCLSALALPVQGDEWRLTRGLKGTAQHALVVSIDKYRYAGVYLTNLNGAVNDALLLRVVMHKVVILIFNDY